MSGPRAGTDRRGGGGGGGGGGSGSGSMGLGGAAGSGHDVVYRMSKKIAQLTKVIYFLNTKHEDHATEVQSTVEAYEDEISLILADARQRIATLEQAQAQLSTEHTALTEAKASETAALQADVARWQAAAEAAEADAAASRARIAVVERAAADAQRQYQVEQTDVEESAREARQALVAAHAAEMDAVHAEGARRLEHLQAQHTAQTTAQQAKYEALQKRLDDMDERYHVEKRTRTYELSLASQAINEQIEDHQRRYALLEQRAEDDAKHAETQVAQLKKQLSDVQAQKRHLERTLADAETRTREIRDQLTAVSGAYEKSQTELQDQKMVLASQEATLIHERHQLKSQLSISLQRIDELTSNMEAAERRLSTLSIAALNKERELTESLEQLQATRGTLDATQHEYEQLASLSQSEKSMLQQKITELENEQSLMRNEFRDSMEALQAESARETAALQRELASYTGNEQDIAALRAELEIAQVQGSRQVQELQQQKAALEKERSADKAAHVTELTKAKHLNDFLAKTNGQLTHNVQLAEQRLVQATEQLQAVKAAQRTLEEQLRASERTVQSVEASGEEAQQALRDEFAAEKVAIKQEYDRRLARETAALQQSLKALEVKHAAAVAQSKQQLERERAKAVEREIAIQEQADRRVVLLQDELAVARDQHASLIAQAEQTLETHLTRASAQLAQARRSWEHRLAAKEAELVGALCAWDAQIEAEHANHMANLSSDQRDMEHRFETYKTTTAAAHEHAIEALRQELTDAKTQACQALVDTHTAAVQQMTDQFKQDMTDTIFQATSRRLQELRELKDQHHAVVTAKDADLAEKTARIQALDEDVARLEGDLSFHRVELSLAEERAAKREQDIAVMKRGFEIDLQELRVAEELKRDSALQQQAASMIAETKAMLSEFETAKTFLKNQVAQYQAQLKQADERYQNREARPIDLETIALREAEVHKLHARIAQMTAERERWVMEMRNRETNFNKIFGQTAVVTPPRGAPSLQQQLASLAGPKDRRGAPLPPPAGAASLARSPAFMAAVTAPLPPPLAHEPVRTKFPPLGWPGTAADAARGRPGSGPTATSSAAGGPRGPPDLAIAADS